MTDMKMTDQITGHENAGHQNAGREIAGHEISRHGRNLFIVVSTNPSIILAVLWKNLM